MKSSRRIAGQIIGIVMLVFIGIAVIGGVVKYHLIKRELTRNQQIEARALVVSIAGFIRPEDWSEIVAGRAAATELPAALSRVAHWQILQQLTLRDARDGQVVFSYPSSAVSDAPPLKPILAELAQRQFLVPPSVHGPVQAYAAIHRPGGEIAGVLCVVPDHTRYDEARRALLWPQLWQSGGVILLGLGVSLLLAFFLSREIRVLGVSTHQIGTPEFSAKHRSIIREVKELHNTFSVLHNVLDDVRARTRLSLVQAETFRTEMDLARVFATEESTTWQLTLGAVELHAASTGFDASSGFVRAALLPAGGGVAFLGQVVEANALAASLLASSAGTYLLRAAESQPIAAVLSAGGRRFSLQNVCAVSWSEDHVCTTWSYDPADGAVTAREVGRLTSDQSQLFSILGAKNHDRGELIGRLFASRAPGELIALLTGSLDPTETGLALAIRLAKPVV